MEFELAPRNWKTALARGLSKRCPQCGKGHLFSGYIKTNTECDRCGLELHHHRADDAPPYFTMFLVGHLVVPLMLLTEKRWHPDLVVHFLLWLPLTLVLSLLLLPAVKGALIGLQWAFRMHGFSGQPDQT